MRGSDISGKRAVPSSSALASMAPIEDSTPRKRVVAGGVVAADVATPVEQPQPHPPGKEPIAVSATCCTRIPFPMRQCVSYTGSCIPHSPLQYHNDGPDGHMGLQRAHD